MCGGNTRKISRMKADTKLLAAIREFIETPEGEQEWENVVVKNPELQSRFAVSVMLRVVRRFKKADVQDEIIQHWQARVDFLKKKQAQPE